MALSLMALRLSCVVLLALDNPVIIRYNRVVPVEQVNPSEWASEQYMYYLVNEYLIISSES